MSAYWVNINKRSNERQTKQEATAKSKSFDASLNIYASDRTWPKDQATFDL